MAAEASAFRVPERVPHDRDIVRLPSLVTSTKAFEDQVDTSEDCPHPTRNRTLSIIALDAQCPVGREKPGSGIRWVACG